MQPKKLVRTLQNHKQGQWSDACKSHDLDHANFPLDFPVVVKPSVGIKSEGVSKVLDQDQVATAVDRVFETEYEYAPESSAVNRSSDSFVWILAI